MDIKLHKQATTTPKIRAEIQAASPASRIPSWPAILASSSPPSGVGATVTMSIMGLSGSQAQPVRQGCETFMNWVEERAPFKVQAVLTDNGKSFNNRFTRAGERAPAAALLRPSVPSPWH